MFNLHFHQVRILSAILGKLDAPEMAAVACKRYLKELNSVSHNVKEFSSHERKIKKPSHLSRVGLTNYFVFHFTETLGKRVLDVDNWLRLNVSYSYRSSSLPLHPIRSVGLRMVIEFEEINELPKYEGTDAKSISFSEPI